VCAGIFTIYIGLRNQVSISILLQLVIVMGTVVREQQILTAAPVWLEIEGLTYGSCRRESGIIPRLRTNGR
jgi:hypothetical protein